MVPVSIEEWQLSFLCELAYIKKRKKIHLFRSTTTKEVSLLQITKKTKGNKKIILVQLARRYQPILKLMCQ